MKSDFNQKVLRLAARNIVQEVGYPPSGVILVVCSNDKYDIAQVITDELKERELEYHLLKLGNKLHSAVARLQALIRDVAGNWGMILLIQPEHASFLSETLGRPDLGIRISTDYFFCDWSIHPASLVRTYGIDMGELHRFRQSLLSEISEAREIRITTERGTDITINPRSWNVTNGEVATAPVEGRANGTIYVDGCAYGGPPALPFMLRIENGRVVNLSDLSEADEQQLFARKDLTRDENCNVLAEFGIGINPGARWNEGVMESEQTRGTCHFGFGHNVEYGGQNTSSYHFDFVVLRPIIEVDGRCICRAGQYSF